MRPFEGQLKLSGVHVGELRVRRIGSSGPANMAKIAIVDESMSPVSMSVFSGFSPKTNRLIEALCESIEEDFLTHLVHPSQEEDPSTGPPDEEEEGLRLR